MTSQGLSERQPGELLSYEHDDSDLSAVDEES
jgi:hypothetical protein